MILTQAEISRRVASGEIVISPFNASQLNPNSYNYRLGGQIAEVDPRVSLGEYDREAELQSIPEHGILLSPGKLYLSSTFEVIGSRYFVTSLIGRSSVGRLGIYVQLTADLGHLGDAHSWTLELTCVQPTRLYAGMLIGQVSFWRPVGQRTLYQGPYTEYSVPKGVLRRFLVGDRS
jgi:dCTP deaminase